MGETEDAQIYSWPWLLKRDDNEGVNYFAAANTGAGYSFATFYVDFALESGDIIAYDYKINTEADCDILHVMLVDLKNTANSSRLTYYSGDSKGWKAENAIYTANRSINVTLGFLYNKDPLKDAAEGEEIAAIKNLRVINASEIEEPTDSATAAAFGNIVGGKYESYETVKLNPADGYYHLYDKQTNKYGALLLADIKSAAMSKFVLIVLCLPNFLSWTMTVGIWANVMSPTDGMLNNFLCDIGILKEPFDFFGSNPWFKPLVIFLKVWKGTGWSSIIFYAAIASIDKSFFEAATLDGASKFQKILWITLPTIVPVIGLQLIMTVTYIMSVGLEQLMAMYTAETKHEQFTVDTYLYEISIQDKTNAPLATVLGIVNGLIALFLMLGGNAISKKLLRTSLW